MALRLKNVASVEEQYKKFPQLDKAEVLKLKEWYEKQPHLPNITELEALIFLHACYYSMEAAKTCLDTYHTTRTHVPDFFAKRDVFGKDVSDQMKILLFAPLPGLTKDGYRVVVCRLTDIDSSKFNYVDTVKLFAMITDLWLMQDGIAEGHAIVIDMEGSTLSHLAKVGIIAMKKFMFYIQEALPVRLKGLHFINTVSFMDKVLALMRPFMKKELMDVMHLHSTLDTFIDKHVALELMPNEYGGSAGSIKEIQAKVFKELQENADFFKDEEQNRRVNEKLRPGKPKNAGDLFGIDGNFKKLDFD